MHTCCILMGIALQSPTAHPFGQDCSPRICDPDISVLDGLPRLRPLEGFIHHFFHTVPHRFLHRFLDRLSNFLRIQARAPGF